MFSLHDFILAAVTGMVGHYPDWQVREYALGWYSKSLLTEIDLSAVSDALAAQAKGGQENG